MMHSLRSLLTLLYIFMCQNGHKYKAMIEKNLFKGVKKDKQKGVGVGDDEDDGEDERCVVEGDSIRGVKANRTKHRGHRCAVCSPDCRQAAAQTALSAQRAYHTAGGPDCPAPPSTWTGCTTSRGGGKSQQTLVVRFKMTHYNTEKKCEGPFSINIEMFVSRI